MEYGFTGCHDSKFSEGILVIRYSVRDGGCPFLSKNIMSCPLYLISCPRFEKNLTKLKYTVELLPLFVKTFWEARQMIRACKYYMKDFFVPLWPNLLDESMSIWFNK